MEKKSAFASTLPSSLLALCLLIGLYFTSLYSFLLFHTLVELFTIIVAAGTFVIAWNARELLDNNYLLFLGITTIFVAFVDLMHTLAYQGMGVFGEQTGNLATQLWLAARYLQAGSLLVAPFLLRRKLRAWLAFSILAVITIFLLSSIFYWQVFPVAYINGLGLTSFKIISEYVIAGIFLVSILLLLWKRNEFDSGVMQFILLFIAFSIASEIAFTEYVGLYGPANMVGHFLKLIAFYCLYKAVIETGLIRPYAILWRDLQRTDESLREYSATLETRNTELDAYAHSVAHDLKNPLTTIITVADAISDIGDLSEREKREFLDEIRLTAFEMDGIIDNLLLLSEVRKVEAPRHELDMSDIVDRIRRRMKFEASKRHALIAVPRTWPAAIGYAPWVEEVWANYISNALKYGGKPPELQLGAEPGPDGAIRFWVQDNGPGISPEARRNLFMPFSRLGNVQEPGHGLGLSIVRRIVENLGGQVGVESTLGCGARFYFDLPAARHVSSVRKLPEAA